MKKTSLALFSLSLAATFSLAAAPKITSYTLEQDAKTHLVTIKYTLSEDAIVTLDVQTNGVSIGLQNFKSIVSPTSDNELVPAFRVLRAGEHTILWKPQRDWPGFVFDNNELGVTLKAWPLDNPPDIMVVRLDDMYHTEKLTRFYEKIEDLPGGLKVCDPEDEEAVEALKGDEYRSSKMVFKRVSAAGNKWRMGSPESETKWRSTTENLHYVTMTNDYYLAIYPMTYAQFAYVAWSFGDKSVTPKCYTAYYDWRGGMGNSGDGGSCYVWPAQGHAVDPNKYMQKIRSKTGLEFDFPTEAQWEYACRAGTAGPYGDGSSDGHAIGWDVSNSGSAYNVGMKLRPVGLKIPNAWGFYDMHGNAGEWVLDQWGDEPTEPVTEPAGPTDNPDYRVWKGGSAFTDLIVSGRSAARGSCKYGQTYSSSNPIGVRLCCPAVIPMSICAD